MDKTIEKLNWRYATKKFDNSKKISRENLDTLLEATRLSASSYGLQPYHVFVIENKEIKKELREMSYGQSQISDASHLIVFASKTTFKDELIDNYIKNISNTRGLAETNLQGYSNFMKSKLMRLSDFDKEVWSSKQVYLALGSLMTIAAELEIDTCPLEGFEVEKYNKILELNEKNLNAAVVLAIGYRSREDETQHYAKVRKSTKELFTFI